MAGFQLWDTIWTQGTYGTAGDWLIQPPPPLDDPEIETFSADTPESVAANSGGLQSLDPVSTAILLALYTDARLPDSMVGQFGFKRSDQHEWHGNTFGIDASNNEEPLGSLLWTLRRAPLVPYTCKLAEHFCAVALQPLVRQRLIGSYDIVAEVDKPHSRINIHIRTYDPDRQFLADIAPLK